MINETGTDAVRERIMALDPDGLPLLNEGGIEVTAPTVMLCKGEQDR